MGDNTKIEWTDATWNVITGCSVISPGCTNCYAMRLAGTRLRDHPSRTGLITMSKAGPVWNGKVRFNWEWLLQPLHWKRQRMIFVCAHGDVFHEGVADYWLDLVFAVMALCPRHTFQVLTKRPERMRAYCTDRNAQRRIYEEACNIAVTADCDAMLIAPGIDETHAPPGPRVYLDRWPLDNVWLGVSCEDQQRANERIPILLDTPAAVRWVSAEPLLGPIDFESIPWDTPFGMGTLNALTGAWRVPHKDGGASYGFTPFGVNLKWVVVGGESGDGARPMHPDWARSSRDQCKAADVAFNFKQWGAWVTEDQSPLDIVLPGEARCPWSKIDDEGRETSDPTALYHVGKKRAGRLLDGVEHNEFPVSRVSATTTQGEKNADQKAAD